MTGVDGSKRAEADDSQPVSGSESGPGPQSAEGTVRTTPSSSSGSLSSRPRRPRILTEDRRIQNREAQRAYRKRQKQRVHDLEKKVAESEITLRENGRQPVAQSSTSTLADQFFINEDVVGSLLNPVIDFGTTISNSDIRLDLNADLASSDLSGNVNLSSWTLSGDELEGLRNPNFDLNFPSFTSPPAETAETAERADGDSVAPEISVEASEVELSHTNRLVRGAEDYRQLEELFSTLSRSTASLSRVLKAGMDALGVTANPREQLRTVGTGRINPPQLSFNSFQIIEIPLHDACLRNAALLGVSAREALQLNYPSPFVVLGETSTAVQRAWKHQPVALQPTELQIKTKHHFFLDTFPFPTFRDKIIQTSGMSPPLYDLYELLLDLKTGMRCWGGGQVSGTGTATGNTWDSRNWEFEPWILSKWWFLFDEEIVDQSKWWRSMRGENT